MAALWLAKDGTRPKFEDNGPYTQSGPGVHITVDEALAILGGSKALYQGTDAPSIRPGPVRGDEKNVIVEIEADDMLGATFDRIGFYYVPDIRPHQAEERLEAKRSAV